MHVLQNLTGSENYQNLRIERGCAKLMLQVGGLTSTQLLDLLNGSKHKISISLENSNGSEVKIANGVKLINLIEFCSIMEGFYRIKETASGAFQVTAQIDISPLGNVQLNPQDAFVIKIEQVPTSCTYNIYTVELPKQSKTVYTYDNVNIPQGTLSKPITANEAMFIILPKAQLQEVQCAHLTTTPQGVAQALNLKQSLKELETMSDDSNDIVSVNTALNGDQTATYGSGMTIIYNIEDVKNYELYVTGTSNYDFVVVDTKEV